MMIPEPAAMLQRCRWHPLSDRETLQQVAAQWILAAAVAAIELRGQFLLVLAGGETPRGVYQRLRLASTDWSAWHLYFGDERCLPANDVARNSRSAGKAWLDHVAIPTAQIHLIPAELGARRAAEVYAGKLRGVGDFDLVLLGLGADGHTASLFPGHDWGSEPGSPDTLAVSGAPKAPSERVSLSAARLSRARQVMFLVAGENKRAALADWRSGKALPASSIAPSAGVDVLVEAINLSSAAGAPWPSIAC